MSKEELKQEINDCIMLLEEYIKLIERYRNMTAIQEKRINELLEERTELKKLLTDKHINVVQFSNN